MKNARLFLSLVAAAACSLPAGAAPAPHARQQPRTVTGQATIDVPRIVVNGRVVQTDVAPRIIQGTTLIPIRFVAEALGATVSWQGGTEAVIDYEGQRVVVQAGENTLVAGSRTIRTTVPTQVIQGRTMVPLRAVAESLGADVRWDPATRTVFVRMVLPDEGAGTPSSDAMVRNSLQVAARTDQESYRVGAPVDLTLSLQNTATRPVRLQMRTGQAYEFIVQRDGQEVWRWSHGRVFTQAVNFLTLAPEETQTFTVAWDQRDNAGSPVPPGTYTVAASVPHSGEAPVGSTATFRIVP